MNRVLRELECLNVINLCDGKILGNVCDIEIDTNCGKVTAIIIAAGKGIFQIMGETIRICWDQIRCIGEDTILVEYKREECCERNTMQKKFGGWFGKYNCK